MVAFPSAETVKANERLLLGDRSRAGAEDGSADGHPGLSLRVLIGEHSGMVARYAAPHLALPAFYLRRRLARAPTND
jgi:hypothetical protein